MPIMIQLFLLALLIWGAPYALQATIAVVWPRQRKAWWLRDRATSRAAASVVAALLFAGWPALAGIVATLIAFVLVAGPVLREHADLRRHVLGLLSAHRAPTPLLRHAQLYLLLHFAKPPASTGKQTSAKGLLDE